jgi:hypothetical protein
VLTIVYWLVIAQHISWCACRCFSALPSVMMAFLKNHHITHAQTRVPFARLSFAGDSQKLLGPCVAAFCRSGLSEPSSRPQAEHTSPGPSCLTAAVEVGQPGRDSRGLNWLRQMGAQSLAVFFMHAGAVTVVSCLATTGESLAQCRVLAYPPGPSTCLLISEAGKRPRPRSWRCGSFIPGRIEPSLERA